MRINLPPGDRYLGRGRFLGLRGLAEQGRTKALSWVIVSALVILGLMLFVLPFSGAVASPELSPSMTSYIPNDGEIHGVKFHDINGNGVRDGGEQGVPGITICITPLVACTTTDIDGGYWFMDLPPDVYQVTETLPPGTVNTTPISVAVAVGPGEKVMGVDFGNTLKKCAGLDATLVGTPHADTLFGTPGNDVILALGGDDTVLGMEGNDTICLGDGDDFGDGGAGKDRVYGEDGDDLLRGGGGRDRLYGGDGEDVLRGGRGKDRLFGGDHDDVLKGGTGKDSLFGQKGNDVLAGGRGDDRLFGHRGDDVLLGRAGDDSHDCGAGYDFASGGGGTDTATGDCESTLAIP